MQTAARVAAIPPYFFATLVRHIADLRARGVDVIRMDMGSPDLPPAPHIVEALVTAAHRGDLHGYTPFGGTPGYRKAIAEFYRRRFGVETDPETQVIGLIGSKEGLFHITQAFVDAGDAVLVPDPSYPTYAAAARIAGGEVVYMPLLAENDFLPELTKLSEPTLQRAKLMWLNYPNNPTGAVSDLSTLRSAVDLARHWGILLCHDAPYTEVGYDGYRAPSLLEIDGAFDVAIEFNSLSKAYNMAGWRLGMAVGNEQAIRALFTLKSQIDSSHFEPVLQAGIAALTGDQSWLEERNRIYAERRDAVVEGFSACGMEARKPKAALYVWAQLPPGSETSADFCERLLNETGVSITPGVAFGPSGEGYVRVSISTPIERCREAMERLKAWLADS